MCRPTQYLSRASPHRKRLTLTVGDFDELTVEDDFSLLGALKAGEIQTTGNISCADLSATGNADVTGTLDVTGDVDVTGEITTGALDAGSGTIQTTGTISTLGLSRRDR